MLHGSDGTFELAPAPVPIPNVPDQPDDHQAARLRSAADATSPRRRGDRV